MFLLCILVAVIGVVTPQHHQVVPLNEIRHLHAIQQPHLPQDMNVVAATQQFLHQFAQLKALADAAPDPPAHGTHQVAVHHNPRHNTGHYQHQQHFNPHQSSAHNHHHSVHHQPQPAHHQQHVHHQPQQSQHVHQGHGHVPVVNHQGIVVNPNKYPGPLAHNLPAGVHG